MFDIPTQYCESFVGYYLSQPMNTISNVAFLIASLLAYRILRNYRVTSLYILSILLVIVGISSAWWHITSSHLGDILDSFSIVFFGSYAAIQLLLKITKSKVVAGVYFVIFLSLILITERFTLWNGSLPYIVLLVGFVLAGMIFIKNNPSAKGIFISAVLTFVIAILLRSLDTLLCPCMPIGTHFLWHILVAAFGYQIIMMLAHAKN